MKKLLAITRAYTMDALTYRGDILIFTLSNAVHPFILLIIWLAVIASGGNTPMNKSEFLQYYFAVLAIKLWTSAWASRYWSEKIRLGEISTYLLKPTYFPLFLLGNNIGEKLLKTVYLLPLLLILGLKFGVSFSYLPPWTVVSVLLSWLLAAILTFLIDLSILFTTFWLDDIETLDNFANFSLYLFSGHFIPLIVFPMILQEISFFLPFRYTLSLPVEIITKTIVGPQIISGLALQIIWCIMIIFLCRYLWKQGLKRYSAVGT